MIRRALVRLLALAACCVHSIAAVQAQPEDYASWVPLTPEFESTGGGGIMIGGYNPIVSGSTCKTDFTATEPGAGGKVYRNTVEFDAVPMQGGVLCTNGRWRALDGSMSGTTPLRVFWKDGMARRSPN